jgi:hypothetical protein
MTAVRMPRPTPPHEVQEQLDDLVRSWFEGSESLTDFQNLESLKAETLIGIYAELSTLNEQLYRFLEKLQ